MDARACVCLASEVLLLLLLFLWAVVWLLPKSSNSDGGRSPRVCATVEMAARTSERMATAASTDCACAEAVFTCCAVHAMIRMLRGLQLLVCGLESEKKNSKNDEAGHMKPAGQTPIKIEKKMQEQCLGFGILSEHCRDTLCFGVWDSL